MIVSFSDSAQVLKCSYICGFRLVKPDALLEAFCGICNIKKMDVKKAIVTERQFWNALQKFIPKTIPEEVDYVLSSLFHLCTPSKGGNNKWSALLIELLCTLSIFCNGSKSLKLAFMFSIFTDNEDGILKEEEFIFLMSTILKGTCWLTDWGRSQDPEELSSWALVASEVTLQVHASFNITFPVQLYIIMMFRGVHPSPPAYITPMGWIIRVCTPTIMGTLFVGPH